MNDDDLEGSPTPSLRGGGGLVPQNLVQTIGLALVFAFLGGAVAFMIGERDDRPPSRASADVGFLQDMIHHHQQAVTLSFAQLDGGSSGGAGLFAREIAYFQSYEIGMMDRQLRSWGYSIDQRPERAMGWMGMDVDPDAMPGMASVAEFEALDDAADPATVDALFFALIRDHHLGGIAMAEAAEDAASDPWVRELAARMARNQRAEITEMDRARDRAGLPATPPDFVPDPRVAGDPDDHGGHEG